MAEPVVLTSKDVSIRQFVPDAEVQAVSQPLREHTHKPTIAVIATLPYLRLTEIPAVISEFDMPNTVCAPATIQFTNNSLTLGPNTNFFWDFGDGTTSTSFQPDHTYSQPGTYQITLIVQDLSSCNLADTITKSVLVLSNSSQYFPNLFSCAGDPVQIDPTGCRGYQTYT